MADRRLQVFHAVAKHGSFTRAAEALFMTQPAVTFQVRSLEEELDTRLFDRQQNRISLTAAGTLALEYAERILALSTEMRTRVKEMSGRVAGPLRVGASTTVADFLLPRLLGEFKARHPGALPHLFVANSETVQNRILERSLEVGFIEGDSHLPTLSTEPCCDDELQVVCAPSHALARLKSVTPALLAEHAYVAREAGSGTREVVDRYLGEQGLSSDTLQPVMELGSPEALKGVVATGLGFTILSSVSVAKEIRLGDLACRPLVPPLRRRILVVTGKERFHSRLVESFVEYAKAGLLALVREP